MIDPEPIFARGIFLSNDKFQYSLFKPYARKASSKITQITGNLWIF